MNDILEYKGYHTKVKYDVESRTLRGIIEGISDFINFETGNPDDVENEFHTAVDDYLEFCEEVGKSPEKEYKGTFNIRIRPDLHKKIALKALKSGESINRTVERAIESYVNDKKQPLPNLMVTIQTMEKPYENSSMSSFSPMNTYWPIDQGSLKLIKGGVCNDS